MIKRYSSSEISRPLNPVGARDDVKAPKNEGRVAQPGSACCQSREQGEVQPSPISIKSRPPPTALKLQSGARNTNPCPRTQ